VTQGSEDDGMEIYRTVRDEIREYLRDFAEKRLD
jgi:hypothetical protein